MFNKKITSLLALLLVLLTSTLVFAAPPIPATYLGTVSVDGAAPVDGTVVEAHVNDLVLATFNTTGGNFALTVPGDDTATAAVEGAAAGDTVEFFVDGVAAAETMPWAAGAYENLSLTVTTAVANALASETLLVYAFTYQADGFDGHPTGNSDGFIVLKNVSAAPVSLAEHKLGDEETQDGDEGMYLLPDIELAADALLIIAEDADLYAFDVTEVDYSFAANDEGVPTLTAYAAWSSGAVDLDDRSDEIVLLDGNDAVVDGVCYGVTHEVCVGDTTASTREQDAARAQILLLKDGRLLDSVDAAGYTRQSDTDTNERSDFMLHPTAVTLSDMATTSTDHAILLWVPILLLATGALVRRETIRLEQPMG